MGASGDAAPGAVAVATGGAAHGLRAAVDEHGVDITAAVQIAAAEALLGDDLAVTAAVGVAPGTAYAGGTAFQGLELGLLGAASILAVE